MNNKQRQAPKLAPDVRAFKWFILSAITFLSCLGAMVYANLNMEPGPNQEMIALVALVIAVPAGALGLWFYLKMLWVRIQFFMSK